MKTRTRTDKKNRPGGGPGGEDFDDSDEGSSSGACAPTMKAPAAVWTVADWNSCSPQKLLKQGWTWALKNYCKTDDDKLAYIKQGSDQFSHLGWKRFKFNIQPLCRGGFLFRQPHCTTANVMCLFRAGNFEFVVLQIYFEHFLKEQKT